MPPRLHVGGAFLLAAAMLSAAPQEAAKPNKAPAPKAMPKGGTPKAFPKGAAKGDPGGPRLNNPAAQFQRLIAMPPDLREQVLEKLPPMQQERLRQRLANWDKLPPAQKAFQLEMLNRYASLPPDKQAVYLQQIQAFNQLPRDRRQELVRELRILWRLPKAQRDARLASDDYKGRFSQPELEMLAQISETNPLPPR
jgi:hypothetical protein